MESANASLMIIKRDVNSQRSSKRPRFRALRKRYIFRRRYQSYTHHRSSLTPLVERKNRKLGCTSDEISYSPIFAREGDNAGSPFTVTFLASSSDSCETARVVSDIVLSVGNPEGIRISRNLPIPGCFLPREQGRSISS